jgi:hypothetical protein
MKTCLTGALLLAFPSLQPLGRTAQEPPPR